MNTLAEITAAASRYAAPYPRLSKLAEGEWIAPPVMVRQEWDDLHTLADACQSSLQAIESLETQWRKDLAALNAIRAERAADLAAIELNNKTLAERDKVIAAAVGYCKRHTHSGVTLSAHVCLLEVLKILEGTA